MLLASAIAVAQVIVAALATLLDPGSRAFALLKTFAWSAALSVALLHLLPESLSELGPRALLALGLALVAPALFARAERAQGGSGRVGLELAFLGLLLHRVADGVGLAVFARGNEIRTDVLVAMSAHAVAVEALVILRYRSLLGLRSAWVRSVGLALAGVLGVLLWSQIDRLEPDPAPWVVALTAGVLIHVAAHDLRKPPALSLPPWTHLLAGVLGVAITQLPGSHSAHSANHHVWDWFGGALIALLPVGVLLWHRSRAPRQPEAGA